MFTATHVALTAAKLDNICLADTYQYLTAIVQETGVSASALPGIFDQITAAAAVSALDLDAVAGGRRARVGRHHGRRELEPVDRSGSPRRCPYRAVWIPVGDGVRSWRHRLLHHPRVTGMLSMFGVDGSQGFTEALIEAIQKASTEGLGGRQKQELAGAFFGPLSGARLSALFNAPPKELERYIAGTAPGASNGLANRQLGITVGQANNQLALLKINLQNIGAELTGTGIDAPFMSLTWMC